jgi:hypothetical protein
MILRSISENLEKGEKISTPFSFKLTKTSRHCKSRSQNVFPSFKYPSSCGYQLFTHKNSYSICRLIDNRQFIERKLVQFKRTNVLEVFLFICPHMYICTYIHTYLYVHLYQLYVDGENEYIRPH